MNYEIIDDLTQWDTAWLKARAWKLSGTKLWNVMAWDKAQKTQMLELIAENIAELPENYQSPAMERWNYLESFAIEDYEKKFNVKVEQPWLIVRNEFQICSPDWIIYNKEWVVTKAVEVKCLTAAKILKYMLADSFKEVYIIEKPYYWQVVNYFMVIDTLEELSFALYNPDFYKEDHKLYTMTVTRKELQEDIDKAEERLISFKQQLNLLEQKLWLINKNT